MAIATPEYPAVPYGENIGARPEAPLESMIRKNPLNGGLTHVNQFTQILTGEIGATSLRISFAFADGGVRSWISLDNVGQAQAGHARMHPYIRRSAPLRNAIL